ncbi:2-oxoglutarate dehydrogenase, E2 component, dihydrolipoamide succinyltransferase, partial [Kitasatospora sp. NPDC007106]
PGGGALLAGLLPPGHGIDGLLAPPPPGSTPERPVPAVETAALAALGVALDPWEHLVLGTSRHYPPPAAAPPRTAAAPAPAPAPASTT